MSMEMLTEAMLAMGLSPKASIPLASEENAQLLRELEELNAEKKKAELIWEETNERYEKLQSHHKLANGRINHNLGLLEAFQAEVRREMNILKIRQRVSCKLKEDLKNLQNRYEEHKRYITTTEKELCKRRQHVDDMTNRMKFAKMALIEWEEAIEAGQNANELIQKYFKYDTNRAAQQEQRRQFLLLEIFKSRQQLVSLYDEQKTLEQNLECTAGLYRQAHMERRQMVNTWKQSVQTMVQRENDIYAGEEHLLVVKQKSIERSKALALCDKNLNEIIANNRQVEESIEELNKESSDIKQHIQKLADMIILKENDVDLMQKELNNILGRVQQQRFENREHLKEKQRRMDELDNISSLIEQLKERSRMLHNRNISAQERLQQLELLADAEEKNHMHINAEAMRVNNLLFKTQQNVTEFKDEAKIIEVSMHGVKQNMIALRRKSRDQVEELKRKTELHYDISFRCLDVERSVIRLQGGVLDQEYEAKNMEILTKLEEQHTQMQRRLATTEAQNKKLDDNMRKMVEVMNADSKRLADMHYQVKEAQSYCEGGVKQLKLQIHSNQIQIVDLNILKMRARGFEQDIEKNEENTYHLQMHRLRLNRSIKDRIIVIKSQMDLLKLKAKHLKDEEATLRADIGERNKQIEAVHARFELATKRLGTNDDGTMITATQLRVESAQEKQCILEEGNILNAQVLTAEREIKALENSLFIMNTSNNQFRYECGQLKDAEAVEELKKLKEAFCDNLALLRNIRCKLLKLEQDKEIANGLKLELESNLKLRQTQKIDQMEILKKSQKEIQEQQEKFQRAQRDFNRNWKAIQQRAFSKEVLALFNRNFEIRQLEQRNIKVLNQLADLVNVDDIIGPKIIKALAKRGLQLPHLIRKVRSTATMQSATSELSMSLFSSQGSNYSDESEYSSYMQSSTRVSVVSIDFPGK